MSRRRRKRSTVGLPPGSLVHTGEQWAEGVSITITDYDSAAFEVRQVSRLSELDHFRDDTLTTWIDVVGLHDPAVIEQIGAHTRLHPLTMEDILDTSQRPKLEDLGEYVYISARVACANGASEDLDLDQISIALGPDFVISFRERESGMLDAIKDRLRNGQGRLRSGGADYLAYRILDAIVDSYFIQVERLEDKLEDLEHAVLSSPTPETLHQIHATKRNVITLRKALWPLREVVGALERRETCLIQNGTIVFLRDVYDHTVQLIDTVESLRDVVSGILDIYLSNLSNRLNEVMKVLTIIATIFMPLSFLTGVYGMNFEHFPEIRQPFWYPWIFWGLCLSSVSLMLSYFRRKHWM